MNYDIDKMLFSVLAKYIQKNSFVNFLLLEKTGHVPKTDMAFTTNKYAFKKEFKLFK